MYYKFKKIIGNINPYFSILFKTLVKCLKKDGYNLSIKRQTAYLVLTRSFLKALLLFSCTAVVQALDSRTALTKSFKWLVEDGQVVCYINYWFSLALSCSVDIYSIVSSKCFDLYGLPAIICVRKFFFHFVSFQKIRRCRLLVALRFQI